MQIQRVRHLKRFSVAIDAANVLSKLVLSHPLTLENGYVLQNNDGI